MTESPDKPGVLFVDDEAWAAVNWRYTFEDRYRVAIANSADEAMAVLENPDWPIYAVVIDQRMPGKTGLQLCEELCAAGIEVPRVILTAYAGDFAERDPCAEGLCRAVIGKTSRGCNSELPEVLAAAVAQSVPAVPKQGLIARASRVLRRRRSDPAFQAVDPAQVRSRQRLQDAEQAYTASREALHRATKRIRDESDTLLAGDTKVREATGSG